MLIQLTLIIGFLSTATATATPSPNHINVGNEAAIGITVAAVLMILAVIGRVKKSEV